MATKGFCDSNRFYVFFKSLLDVFVHNNYVCI